MIYINGKPQNGGSGGSPSPLTTKGDLFTRDGSGDARLPVGADGAVFIADSTQSTGNRWGTLLAHATAGARIYADSNQSFPGPGGGLAQVSLDLVAFDDAGYNAGAQFTVPTGYGGAHFIEACFTFDPLGHTGPVPVQIQRSTDGGSTWHPLVNITLTSYDPAQYNSIPVSVDANLNDGDQIRLYVQNGTSGNINGAPQGVDYLVFMSIRKYAGSLVGAAPLPALTEGRLTAASGNPLPTDIVVTSPTLYYTPYKGNRIALLIDGVWTEKTFAEISIANTGLANLAVYDVFAYWTGSAVALEFSAAYADYETRTDAITLVDGVQVKSSDHTRKLIGTIMAASAGFHTPPFLFIDAVNARLISNLYNAEPRPLEQCLDHSELDILHTYNWNFADGNWTTPVINNLANYVEWTTCEPREVHLQVHASMAVSGGTRVGVGIGVNPGDEDWSTGNVVATDEIDGSVIRAHVSYDVMSKIGNHVAFMTAFADTGGGSGTMVFTANGTRRGSSVPTILTYVSGWVKA